MAVTSASASNGQTIDTTGGLCFDATADDLVPCTAIRIGLLSSSANPLLINCEQLHTSGEFGLIPAGDSIELIAGEGAIRKVTIKGGVGSATGVYWYVSARTGEPF